MKFCLELESCEGVQAGAGSGVFNVKDYDAVGDGIADDAAAIQGAIDAAHVGGGIVWCPPGSYNLGSAVYVKSGVTLDGGSALSTSFVDRTDLTSLLHVSNASDVTFRNLTIERTGGGYGIYTFGANRLTVENCSIIGDGPAGIIINDGTVGADIVENVISGFDRSIWVNKFTDSVSVVDNVFSNWGRVGCVYAVGDGGHSNNLVIAGNRLSDPDESLGVGLVGYPIVVSSVSEGMHRNVTIRDNVVVGTKKEFNSDTGTPDQISINHVDGGIIANNHSIDGGDMGITVANDCHDISIVGNVCRNNDACGIWVGTTPPPQSTDGVTVSGNVCSDNGVDRSGDVPDSSRAGIRFRAGAKCSVSGNVCIDRWGTQMYGLTIDSACLDIEVGSNMLTGNVVGPVLDER